MTTRRKLDPTGPTLAIGYIRASTAEQDDSGLGLAAQEAAIRGECARRGWALAGIGTDIASGKSTRRRPEFARVLDLLDRGEATVLVAAKLDRLARSTLDFATIAERGNQAGWELVVLDIDVDTTTPAGKFMRNVIAAAAEYERDLIAQRTRDALAVKKAAGVRLGRPVVMPAGVRARIAREHAKGRSLARIAADLTAEKVPTARGGARWYPSTVRAVLGSLALDQAAA